MKVNKQKAEDYSLNYVYKKPESSFQNLKKIQKYTHYIFKLCKKDDFDSEYSYNDKYYSGAYSFMNHGVLFNFCIYLNELSNIKPLFEEIEKAINYTKLKIQNDKNRLLRYEKLEEILTKYMKYFLENYK